MKKIKWKNFMKLKYITWFYLSEEAFKTLKHQNHEQIHKWGILVTETGWQGQCHLKDWLRKPYVDCVQWTRQVQLASSLIFNSTRHYHHTADLAQSASSQLCASKKVALCTFIKCEALEDIKWEYRNNVWDLSASWEKSGHEKTEEITLLRY